MLQTQYLFIRGDEALFREEAQRERIASWVRLFIGLAGALLFAGELLLGRSTLTLFTLRLISIMVFSVYSALFLFGYSKPAVKGPYLYLTSFLDATIVTLILWSYSLTGSTTFFVKYSVFAVYFLVIFLTALHHQPFLGLFAGAVVSLEYSAHFFFAAQPEPVQYGDWVSGYSMRLVCLMTGGALAGLVSWKNLSIFQEVVSSHVRYHDLVGRLPEMLFTLDRSERFVWANRAAKAIFGITAQQMVGKSIREQLVDPEQLRLDAETVRGTFEVRDVEGKRKYVDCTLRRVDGDPNGASWEGLMSDSTDREIAMAQREEMASRLFTYQKMESLSTLASGMAHDFNNILQTVNDIVGTVQKESSETDTKRRMELISETMVDAKFLISELLALGRKQPLNYTTVNLCSFFGTVAPFFQEQLGANYRISFQSQYDQLWIQGDPDYLKRIFQNLVGNSRDAMPGGGTIAIDCSAQHEEGKPSTVIIRFSDSGTGIPHDLTERVFDPFFTTKKPGKGTGLGLALVRQIVSLHNGRVTIEKTGSSGTTFRIEIPEVEKEDFDLDTKHIMLNRLSSTVLLLEDDAKIREILKIFVSGCGYPVCEASNRSEALSQLRKHVDDCQVLIMDWKLGTDDPHEVIRAAREVKKNLIVIVVSGYPPKQKSIEAMGIYKWVTKPYDKNLIDLEIQRALYRLERPAE